jgi:hypothetical protein
VLIEDLNLHLSSRAVFSILFPSTSVFSPEDSVFGGNLQISFVSSEETPADVVDMMSFTYAELSPSEIWYGCFVASLIPTRVGMVNLCISPKQRFFFPRQDVRSSAGLVLGVITSFLSFLP